MTSRLYRDTAIVLRTYRLGESDRIVVMLTENHGKVRAVAKGIRKTKSRFGGRLEPLSYVNVQLHRGSSLDVVSQVETVDASTAVYGDLDAMTEASAILEAVDRLVPDQEPVPQMFRMLLGVRRTLIDRPSPLVVPAFLWKLLAVEGVRPELDRCVGCGAAESDQFVFSAFDTVRGGVQCRSCRTGGTISAEALSMLRDLLGGRLGAVLDAAHDPDGQRLGDPVVNEVAELATRAFEAHVERRLRSLGIFERHDGP